MAQNRAKQVRRAVPPTLPYMRAGLLPEGARYGWDRDHTCITFGIPVNGRPGLPAPALPVGGLPGWVLVLRFCNRNGVVELAGFEVSYFADPLPAFKDNAMWAQRIADEFGEFVAHKASAPAPVDYPVGGLTIRSLRGIRIGEFQRVARQYLARSDVSETLPPAWSRVPSGQPGARKPGRPAKPLLYYASLAQEYLQLCATEANPIAALAKSRNIATSTARNDVAAARRLGLITSPGQGRVGGELKIGAEDILRKAGQLHGEH